MMQRLGCLAGHPGTSALKCQPSLDILHMSRVSRVPQEVQRPGRKALSLLKAFLQLPLKDNTSLMPSPRDQRPCGRVSGGPVRWATSDRLEENNGQVAEPKRTRVIRRQRMSLKPVWKSAPLAETENLGNVMTRHTEDLSLATVTCHSRP